MAKFTGTVRLNDLEGGFYELETRGGQRYRLSRCKEPAGANVEVEGTLESGGFGLQMSGPSITVKQITRI
jgi:hypothetical protein